MAREVEIHLKTVGAQQAAQEVDKVEKELGQLESQARRADAALDGVAASAGAASTGAGGVSAPGRRIRRKGAAQGVKELAQESGKASQSAGMLGQKATQVGYQVQDLAVQIQGGTSALTAFAQQGSQLLGIFGPGGALAGALLAVGAMAAQIFMRVREGGDDSAESIEELTEQAKKLAEELGNAAEARGIESVRQWIDSLTDEEAAVERVNAALDRNLKLMQERRRRQAEEDSAQDALDLATIDADPNMSEEEKIRARAMIAQRAAGRRTASRIAELGDEVTTAQTRARRAVEAVERASGDTNLARAELISRKEEAKRLEQQQAESENAKQQVKLLEFQLKRVEQLAAEAESRFHQASNPFATVQLERARDDAKAVVGRVRSQLDQFRQRADAFTPEHAVRLDALGGADGEGEISELEKRLAELEERERQLREEANKAGAERDLVVANANEEVASLRRRQELDIKAREITTDATVRELRTREEEKAKREQEAEERRRQREQERIERQAAATGGTQATAAARSLGAPDRAVRQLEALGMAMQSDPSAENLERFEKMLEQLLAFAERRNEADSAAAERVRRLKARVESLRIQQSKLRDRGNMKDAALAILPFGNIGADRREAARNKAVEEAEEAENEARRRWTLLTRQLRELERDAAQAEELRKSLEEAEKEEAAAVEAANRSGRIAEEATIRRVTEQPRMREVLENQTAARRVQAEKEIADRRKAEEEKQRRDREADESKRRAEQTRMEKSIAATGGTQATSAARSLGAPDRAVRQIEALGMAMQSDPSAENLERFEKMLEQLLAFAERRNEADSAAAERVRRLEARVESLRIQQSKLRDGK